jgi:hypothetical protein
VRYFLVLPLLFLLVTACTDDAPSVSNEGSALFADMQFYPTTAGSDWTYRVDTLGNSGMIKGVGQIRSSVGGTFDTDSLIYSVQVNEVFLGGTQEFDTVYVRKAADGVRLSSPGLQQIGGLGNLLGLPIGDLPTEFLAVPYAGGFQAKWDILNIEYNQIPFFPIFYRVEGSYRGIEDVNTDQRIYRDCAHVVISIEAQLPNLEDPTNILNPLRINEKADFWFTRPHGLVVADGSNAIFTLLRGGIPLSNSFGRTRQEVISMNIVQPDPFCLN